MTDRTTRLLLWLLSALFISLGAGVLLASFLVPTEIATGDLFPPSAIPNNPHRDRSKPPALDEEDFRWVWGKALQRPIADAPPVVEPQPAPPIEPSPVPDRPEIRIEAKLVGTLVDGQTQYARAWIDVRGKRRMVTRGDVLVAHKGSPTIAEIEDGRVILNIDDQSHALVLAKPYTLGRPIRPGEEESRVD